MAAILAIIRKMATKRLMLKEDGGSVFDENVGFSKIPDKSERVYDLQVLYRIRG
jgi:hypothetical protein